MVCAYFAYYSAYYSAYSACYSAYSAYSSAYSAYYLLYYLASGLLNTMELVLLLELTGIVHGIPINR
jgi:hypothetical protein